MRDLNVVLTASEAALVLDLTPQTVRILVAEGKLRAVPGPGPLRLDLVEVWNLRDERAKHPIRGGRPRLNLITKIERLQEALACRR
jgi:hypothetical protein